MLTRTNHFRGHIVADKGEQLYRDLFQDEYEATFPGQFAVIEIVTKRAYVSETAEGAISNAMEKAPHGLFHMVRIQGPATNGTAFYFRKLLVFALRIGDIRLS